MLQVPNSQVRVQVQVQNPQVRVQLQVHENGSRVLLEYKYKYQVLHHWYS